jgi:hypothetical protein
MELVPKNTSGWSLITYLSYPPGNSVNDFIDEKLTTVQYSKFDNVIYIIQTLNEHVKIGNIHIKSAFRFLPCYPGDFDLLGFKLETCIIWTNVCPWDVRYHVPRLNIFLHLCNGSSGNTYIEKIR